MPTQTDKYLIGLDLGTSSVKAVMIDKNGQTLNEADEEYAISSPKPGWAEQDPEGWLKASVHVVSSLMKKSGVDRQKIAALGLSGQMHGLVVIDRDGVVLRPAIIWADRRSAPQAQRIKERLGLKKLGDWTGNPVATGFMLPSWLWMMENETGLVKSACHLLLPKDYLRFRLCGSIGAEASDASSTSLFNPEKMAWSQPLLKEFGIPETILPPIYRSLDIAGGLLPEIADVCGLSSGTPVVYGGSDVSLQALAQGIIDPGNISCTIGTGGQLFAPLKKAIHDPELRLHLFCHVIPERWHFETAILSAGLSLRWLRDHLWQGQTYNDLADRAQKVEAAFQGLYFLPYLVGERTPVMDPKARAAFIGLTWEHDQSHIVRAVMEGVVFALRQGLDIIRSMQVPVERIIATGASIRHPLWVQLQADIFNQAVYPSETQQASGYGAAFLAGLGLGMFTQSDVQALYAKNLTYQPCQPNPQRAESYQKAYDTYCRIYPAVKTINQ